MRSRAGEEAVRLTLNMSVYENLFLSWLILCKQLWNDRLELAE